MMFGIIFNRRAVAAALMAVSLAILAVTGFMAAEALAAEAGWRLRIDGAAVAGGERVLLGEIAEPVGNISDQRWQEVAAISLWKAPALHGRQQALARAQIQRMLDYYVPELAGAFVLPGRLVVQRGGRVFGRTTIERRVVEFLTARAAALGGEAEFKDLQIPAAIFANDEMATLDVALSEDMEPGRVGFVVRALMPDGQVIRRVSGSAFVNLWKAVACAAQPINRLERVTPDKITFIKKNLAYVGQAWDGKGGPWRMKSSVGRGQPLLLTQMEIMPMVRKGGRVNLVYQGGRIQLSVKAEALADGDMGEMIEVRNMQSKKIVLATVVDEYTVVVH